MEVIISPGLKALPEGMFSVHGITAIIFTLGFN
jgi:hypothetical protein